MINLKFLVRKTGAYRYATHEQMNMNKFESNDEMIFLQAS